MDSRGRCQQELSEVNNAKRGFATESSCKFGIRQVIVFHDRLFVMHTHTNVALRLIACINLQIQLNVIAHTVVL